LSCAAGMRSRPRRRRSYRNSWCRCRFLHTPVTLPVAISTARRRVPGSGEVVTRLTVLLSPSLRLRAWVSLALAPPVTPQNSCAPERYETGRRGLLFTNPSCANDRPPSPSQRGCLWFPFRDRRRRDAGSHVCKERGEGARIVVRIAAGIGGPSGAAAAAKFIGGPTHISLQSESAADQGPRPVQFALPIHPVVRARPVEVDLCVQAELLHATDECPVLRSDRRFD
jgi:hypothetical protein